MGVHGCVVRQPVVDYVREVVDVEAACGHVGGYEHGNHAVAEFLHHHVALLLREVAMERVGVISVAYKVFGHLLGVASCAAENDGVDVGRVVSDALERQVFVAGIDHVVDVAHVGGAFVAGAYNELHGVVHVSPC